jgi:NAD(P)-dependent dehydrogenase (short-subunit alcohol dehydrogenase family)
LHSRLDVLVNNAFWAVLNKPVDETSDEEWDKTVNVTLRGAFYGCRAAIPAMIASGGGSIVNLSSVAGVSTSPRFAAYSAAKGGILSLTRSVAFDYGPKGIRANTVAPGTIETEAIASVLADPNRRAYLTSKILLGRLGQPDDIAKAILFLACDDSSFMTGQTMVVDGGRTIS